MRFIIPSMIINPVVSIGKFMERSLVFYYAITNIHIKPTPCIDPNIKSVFKGFLQ